MTKDPKTDQVNGEGRPARKRRPLAKRLLLAAGTTALLLGVAEITLRAGQLVRTGTWDFLPEVRMAATLYEPHPYLGYAMKPGVQFTEHDSEIRINRWGFRGPDIERAKPDGVVRILCLGGSTTFSLRAGDNQHTWPAQLQRILNDRHAPIRFEVLNFGTPGYCVVESFISFALRGLDFAPDIVLIQDGLNDVPAVFTSDPASDYTHFRGAYPRTPSGWLKHLAVGRLAILAMGKLSQPHPSGKLALSKEGVQLFQRYVGLIVSLAESRGIEPLLLTTPDRLPADDKECHQLNAEVACARVLAESLRRLGRQAGVPVIDLAAAFPKDQTLFTDDTHKTNKGLELTAQVIADELDQAGVLSGILEHHKGR